MPDIRIADRSEAQPIMRLINAAFVVEQFFIDGERVNLEQVLHYFDTGDFIVADDHAACAWVEPLGERAYLGLLSVDPARQGTGLGRAMVEAAETFARARGCRALDLRVVNVREELPPFYRKLGYRETGTSPFDHGAVTKIPCHFIHMSKDL